MCFALYSAKKSGQDRRRGKTFLRILYKSLIKGFWVYAARAVSATAYCAFANPYKYGQERRANLQAAKTAACSNAAKAFEQNMI